MENFDKSRLNEMTLSELSLIARKMKLVGYGGLSRQEIIRSIVEAQRQNSGNSYSGTNHSSRSSHSGENPTGSGVLETLSEGYGFLRSAKSNYLQSHDDIYVSHSQIRKFGLRTGHLVEGQIRPPKRNTDKEEHYFALLKVEKVNGELPELVKSRTKFDKLTPVHPFQQLKLEHNPREYATRIIDLMAPIGKGQRGIIVAPPYSGKTTLLKNIAHGIAENHPEVTLMVLLIDERPEEVTDVSRSVKGEVVSSTFDEHPERHVQVAEMVLGKAKRSVEAGKDVVILLDSMTRLARACNVVTPHSGKTLTGGLDALAFVKPRRFFGAARKMEDGGSLTVIATALIDTESRADEHIYEEFKGTGNMEVHLERSLLDRSIFPTLNIGKSKTRREELLMAPDVLKKVWVLRKFLGQMDVGKSMEILAEQLGRTKTNGELLEMMVEGSSVQGNSPNRYR